MTPALLDDIKEFLENFVDGAPDASATSKTANRLLGEIEQEERDIAAHQQLMRELVAAHNLSYGG